APAAVVRRAGGAHRLVDVGLVALGDDGLHGAVMREDGLERLARLGVDELAVDEELVAARGGRVGRVGGGGHRGSSVSGGRPVYTTPASRVGSAKPRAGRGATDCRWRRVFPDRSVRSRTTRSPRLRAACRPKPPPSRLSASRRPSPPW